MGCDMQPYWLNTEQRLTGWALTTEAVAVLAGTGAQSAPGSSTQGIDPAEAETVPSIIDLAEAETVPGINGQAAAVALNDEVIDMD
eukprot:2286261-Amphidinium_carterae.1